MDSEDLDEQIEQMLQTPPRCLAGFQLAATKLHKPWDDNPTAVWKLSCKCGSAAGRFLGYSWKDYDKKYSGAETFISPIAFECKECSAVTEILDTDIHGYHAELDSSSKYRGEGPRSAFPCPSCQNETFAITVGFVYWDADELLEEFEGNPENMFNVFLCQCQCTKCSHWCTPVEFGKL